MNREQSLGGGGLPNGPSKPRFDACAGAHNMSSLRVHDLGSCSAEPGASYVFRAIQFTFRTLMFTSDCRSQSCSYTAGSKELLQSRVSV